MINLSPDPERVQVLLVPRPFTRIPDVCREFTVTAPTLVTMRAVHTTTLTLPVTTTRAEGALFVVLLSRNRSLYQSMFMSILFR